MISSQEISKQLRLQRKKIRKALNKIKRIDFQTDNKSLDLRQVLDQRRDRRKTHLHPKSIEDKESMTNEKSNIIQKIDGGLPINFGQPSNFKSDDANKTSKESTSFLHIFGKQNNKGSPIHIGKPFAKKSLETIQREKSSVQEGSSIIMQSSDLNAIKSTNINEEKKAYFIEGGKPRSALTSNTIHQNYNERRKILSHGPSDKNSLKTHYQTSFNINHCDTLSDNIDVEDIQTKKWGIDINCIIMDT